MREFHILEVNENAPEDARGFIDLAVALTQNGVIYRIYFSQNFKGLLKYMVPYDVPEKNRETLENYLNRMGLKIKHSFKGNFKPEKVKNIFPEEFI